MGDFSANQKPAPEKFPEKGKKAFVPEKEIIFEKPKTKSDTLLEAFKKEYDNFTYEEKKLLHQMFRSEDTFSENYKVMQDYIYKKKCPTPEEFLDPKNGWLTQRYVDKLFKWVKDDFIEICSGNKIYSKVVLTGSTRIGKSHSTVLIIYYTIVWMHHLRDINMYYDLAPGTSLSVYIMSYNYAKVNELYLKPLYNLLEISPNFIKVKFQDQVITEQQKVGWNKIVWSKATSSDNYCITLASGLQIAQGNDDALAILGANIVSAFIAEIGFYIESAGATEESIFRLYTDVSERITATVGKNKMSFVLLDSSANNAESKIESHINKELRFREDCFYHWIRRWDVPELHEKNFPIWKKTGQTFRVVTGDGVHSPRIVKDGEDISEVPSSLVIDVPIDALTKFQDNLVKSIKDIAGVASTNESKLIQNAKLIEKIWDQYLPNIEGIITADSGATPQRLIWDRVQNLFFAKYDGTHYKLKRASKEPRWMHIDTAYSVKGDVIGITMIHKEFCQQTKDVIYVCDFSFTIGPGENGINLEALGWFIKDMVSIGQVTLNLITVDTFQSETTVQFLRREGINAEKLSVDTSLEPYMFLYSCLLQENLRVGKNIFLKNNLNSLYRKRGKSGKEKIDHTLGTTTNVYNGDFERSVSGTNAKDCSDSLAGALFNAQKSNHYPVSIYEKENERLYGAGGTVVNAKTPVFSPVIKEIYNSLHKHY